MKLGFASFVKDTNPSFEFNWHHEVQCELIDRWIVNDIKHLMILAPPRSSKTELVSKMLPIYLDSILASKQKVLHLTYSGSMSEELKRSYLRNCKYRLNNSNSSIVKFHGCSCSLSSSFNYIIMDDIIKSMRDATDPSFMIRLWNWYNNDVLTRLCLDGKLLTISSHYPNDLSSKIMCNDSSWWYRAKFPFVSEETNLFRKSGEVLWNRMLPISQSPIDTENKIGKFNFTTLYQQKDLEANIKIY